MYSNWDLNCLIIVVCILILFPICWVSLLHAPLLALPSSTLLDKFPESTNPQNSNRLRKCVCVSLSLAPLSTNSFLFCAYFQLLQNIVRIYAYNYMSIFARLLSHILVHCHTLNWWTEKREVSNGATVLQDVREKKNSNNTAFRRISHGDIRR